MLLKWAEDDRQEKLKAEQRRQKMLDFRQLCNKLDLERHKRAIADKVSLCLSVCLSSHVRDKLLITATALSVKSMSLFTKQHAGWHKTD